MTLAFAVDKPDSVAEDEALQGEYTWTIENFTKVKQLKLYSPVFQSGQYNWCAFRCACPVRLNPGANVQAVRAPCHSPANKACCHW